jgi:cell division protein FtsB
MKPVSNYQWALLATALIVLLAVVFVFNKCNSNKLNERNTDIAVSQNENENLQSVNASLENQIVGYLNTQDSLLQCIREKDVQLIRKEKEKSLIALKYATEKDRVKQLPNDSAVGLFLDRADCTECPVVKYDNDYLVPVDPIRFYNDMAVGFDELASMSLILQSESSIKTMQIKELNSLCNAKDSQIAALTRINENHVLIEAEKDKQVTAQEKKYKAERRKLIVTKVVAGAVIVFESAVIVLTLLK